MFLLHGSHANIRAFSPVVIRKLAFTYTPSTFLENKKMYPRVTRWRIRSHASFDKDTSERLLQINQTTKQQPKTTFLCFRY